MFKCDITCINCHLSFKLNHHLFVCLLIHLLACSLTGMFYNLFNLFEHKNRYMYISFGYGLFRRSHLNCRNRQLTLSAEVHITACQTWNVWWPNMPCFDSQLDHVFKSCVYGYNPGQQNSEVKCSKDYSWNTSLFCWKMNFILSSPSPPPIQYWFQTTKTHTNLSTLILGGGGSQKNK